MLENLQNIPKIPELTKRIGFTLLFLAVFRIGIFVPTPGIDSLAFTAFFAEARGTVLGLFDMFAGGALERFSVFALGIMPYISASIILQLLTVVIPHLERLSKEGEAGRKKITQYTRYGTILLSLIQSFGISIGLERMGLQGESVVLNPGWGFRLMTMITLTSGTAFLMWLGEQISERGIGNGISLIIFSGIVANIPSAVGSTFELLRAKELHLFLLIIIVVLMVVVVGVIVFVERGQRRLPVQYAKRVVGRRMYGGQTTHLPLKINTAGVIPAIFASSILMFPLTIVKFFPSGWIENHSIVEKIIISLGPGRLLFNILYVGFIIFFCYFYTAVTFNPMDVAENIKKHGGYIPGIRPGKRTGEYIDKVLTRITLPGAIYVSIICVIPTLLISYFNVPFSFGGTALLIVVGVAMDTMAQIESHLLTRQYEGLMKKVKIKGRR